MIRNALFQTHWFLGISAGLVLAIVGVTGAALGFEDELIASLNPGVITVEPAGVRLSNDRLYERILAENAGRRVTSMTVYSDPTRAVRIALAPLDQGARPRAVANRRPDIRYADPSTGRLLGAATLRGQSALRFIEQLHRNLAAGPVGKLIVGSSTLALVILALSGLYLRWPKSYLDWREWLRVRWSQRGRALWWHLHRMFGTFALLFYLVLSLTGLYFSFDWYAQAVKALAQAPSPSRGLPKLAVAVDGQPNGRKLWQTFDALGETYTEATLSLPQYPGQAAEVRFLSPLAPHERAFDRVTLQPVNGSVLTMKRHSDLAAGSRFVASIFPLHSGSRFGLVGIVLAMVASLAMPFFTLSGWYLYLKRRRSRMPGPAVRSQAS